MPLAWLQIISEIEVGPKVELSLELRKPALAAVGPGHTVSCDDVMRPGVEVERVGRQYTLDPMFDFRGRRTPPDKAIKILTPSRVSSELQGATSFDMFTENQEQRRLEEIVIWLAIIAIIVDFLPATRVPRGFHEADPVIVPARWSLRFVSAERDGKGSLPLSSIQELTEISAVHRPPGRCLV
ncbi:hypothetical protein FPV67DRAFT_1450980 [Lyophyllum atratum]|nr:hypothetical protein FPV67DRAFT_1450980 [Lyophyllum atratum]